MGMNVDRGKLKNYTLLQLLLDEATIVVRKIFQVNYRSLHSGRPWSDNGGSIAFLETSLGDEWVDKLPPHQKDIFKDGDSEKWDLSLLWSVLRKMEGMEGMGRNVKARIGRENRQIHDIMQVRNKKAHLPLINNLTDEEFEEDWNTVESALVRLGSKKQDLYLIRQFSFREKENTTKGQGSSHPTNPSTGNNSQRILYSNKENVWPNSSDTTTTITGIFKPNSAGNTGVSRILTPSDQNFNSMSFTVENSGGRILSPTARQLSGYPVVKPKPLENSGRVLSPSNGSMGQRSGGTNSIQSRSGDLRAMGQTQSHVVTSGRNSVGLSNRGQHQRMTVPMRESSGSQSTYVSQYDPYGVGRRGQGQTPEREEIRRKKLCCVIM